MLFLILSYVVYLCEGSSILVVFTLPEKSHSVLGDSLVKTLLNAGHEVTYVTPYPKEKLLNLEFVDIASVLDLPDKEKLNEKDVSQDLQMEVLGAKLTQLALKHPNMQVLMMNTTIHFDVVLAEWFYSGLLAPLSSVFECPLIWYTSMDASSKSLGLIHAANNIASGDLSIIQKIYQMWTQLYFAYRNYYHFSSVEMSAYEDTYRAAFESRRITLPNYESLVYNSSMLFMNSHALLGEKCFLSPNAKYIAGHHIGDTVSPLPKNLKKLLDDSYEGVIYVDLETNLINNNMQEKLIQDLLEVFGRVKQTVIWKYDEILVNLPENVYIMKKPPQHSILNHPNTLIALNHGDMTSIISASYFGVPVIGIPMFEDQIANINSMVSKGFAVKVTIKEVPWKAEKAIGTILGNISYQENLKISRSILRNRLISPREEFLYWIQVVIDTRGALHLRSPTQASIPERYNLDILLLIILFLWFCTRVVKLFRVHFIEEDLEKKDA